MVRGAHGLPMIETLCSLCPEVPYVVLRAVVTSTRLHLGGTLSHL